MRLRSTPAIVLPVLSAALLVGCGGDRITVRVLSAAGDQEPRPVEELELTFVPYDRDSIFEAMAARAPTPEPKPSDDLQDQFDQVVEAQQTWRDAEQEWGDLREQLRGLSQRMQGLDRRSREYLELFDRFNELEARVNALERRKDSLFARFDSLQKATVERADSIRAVISAWEDRTFAGYLDIVDSIVAERGVEVRRDTTDAEGYATTFLPGGDWWVYTRHAPGPFTELYWNLHFDPSEADTLVLDPGNAEHRMRL